MLQKVLAPDRFANQVFQWDKQKSVISLPHPKGGAILFYTLEKDGEFHFLRSEPKPHPKSKGDFP